jgi:hypothetical protein
MALLAVLGELDRGIWSYQVFCLVLDQGAHFGIRPKKGALLKVVKRPGKNDGLVRFAVNPGHLLHLEEWVHSPFVPGARTELRSGTAIQMDIIPVSAGPFFYINAEDGVVLADADLRDGLRQRFPACWRRIEARRSFVRHTLGIDLHESVLPLGNTPAWLPPYAMSLENASVKR